MEIFSAFLAIYAENSPATDEFPAQRPVTRSFDVFFDLRPNKRLSKQSWGWGALRRHGVHYDATIMLVLEILLSGPNGVLLVFAYITESFVLL